ncbi:uncharacterized protein PGTG_01344 [Puccinia graminis f. sp. tritici CRL 75-36-700-3]|uniref:RING-type domain-containing protein n=1 Tax=Puccinia graminis f. sp. tritici (strain CRL 75-36-700-3 / race SCCL) TaxID=418459 RepID=E3JVD8_PUCGT|nr:uncharacterized protein PGTG_01344 [Puccinia graminis f. sp. tritici CRL 75-36-700-3]EFP76013.2 hypothetical protein PGTG_01344 [Puccinia graminis f. sp. tritici CRL 75-36-700-3]
MIRAPRPYYLLARFSGIFTPISTVKEDQDIQLLKMASCILLLILAGNILGFESPLDARQIASSSQAIESTDESIGFRRASNSIGQHDWPVVAPPLIQVGSQRPTDLCPTGAALKVESGDVVIEIDSPERNRYTRETPTKCSMESYSRKRSSARGEETSRAAEASNGGSNDGRDDCAVCLGLLDSDLRSLKCKHVFHRECIDGWLRGGRPTCPSCRAEISSGHKIVADQSPQTSSPQLSPLSGPTEHHQPLDSPIQEGYISDPVEADYHMSYARFAMGPTSYPGHDCSCCRLMFFNFVVGIFSIITILIYIVLKNKL